jgi:hypothetical protein
MCCVQCVDDEDGEIIVQGKEDYIGTIFKLKENDIFTISVE